MLGTEATVVAANSESPRAPRLRVGISLSGGSAHDIAESSGGGQFIFIVSYLAAETPLKMNFCTR